MFDTIISIYYQDQNIKYILNAAVLSFLIGFLSLIYRYYVVNEKNKAWRKINNFDKIGLCFFVGFIALSLSFITHIIILVLLGMMLRRYF